MAGNDLMSKSALEQARLVRDGDITARELVEASLSAIERLNGELNAFLASTDGRSSLVAQGVEPEPGIAPVLQERIRTEIEKWHGVIKRAGITAE